MEVSVPVNSNWPITITFACQLTIQNVPKRTILFTHRKYMPHPYATNCKDKQYIALASAIVPEIVIPFPYFSILSVFFGTAINNRMHGVVLSVVWYWVKSDVHINSMRIIWAESCLVSGPDICIFRDFWHSNNRFPETFNVRYICFNAYNRILLGRVVKVPIFCKLTLKYHAKADRMGHFSINTGIFPKFPWLGRAHQLARRMSLTWMVFQSF